MGNTATSPHRWLPPTARGAAPRCSLPLLQQGAPAAPPPPPPPRQVPLALLGLFAFHVPWNVPNLLSILVGTLAGVVFVVAKSRG